MSLRYVDCSSTKGSELKIIEGTSGRSLEYLQQGTKEIVDKHEQLFRQQCASYKITRGHIIDALKHEDNAKYHANWRYNS